MSQTALVVMVDPEQLAQRFHETYERLAPSFGYETRKASAKPWSEVPDQNKRLMVAVCKEVIEATHGMQTAVVRTLLVDPVAEPAAEWKEIPAGTPCRIRINQEWLKDTIGDSRHKPVILVIGEGAERKTCHVSEAVCLGDARTEMSDNGVKYDALLCKNIADRHASIFTAHGVRYRI